MDLLVLAGTSTHLNSIQCGLTIKDTCTCICKIQVNWDKNTKEDCLTQQIFKSLGAKFTKFLPHCTDMTEASNEVYFHDTRMALAAS
jgi:hypothetical protein